MNIPSTQESARVPLVQDRHLVVEAVGEKPLSARTRRWIGNIAATAAVGAIALIGAPMLMHADNPSASMPAAAVTTGTSAVTGGLVTAP